MAGHSQFKNIMYRKGAQDKKRAKIFAKLIRELTTAARSGLADPAANPRLRAAVLAARAANMPKDTVERAIRRGAGGEGQENYEEVRYEGYGPGGVAVIVEALTDNRNRSASEVRAAFTKSGGNLGESNSVSFIFDRVGEIVYPAVSGDAGPYVRGGLSMPAPRMSKAALTTIAFSACRTISMPCGMRWSKMFGSASSAKLVWKPKSVTAVEGETAESLLRLLETLEDSDDVQNVYANFDMSEEAMARLSA